MPEERTLTALPAQSRLHDLDALRAFAMLLGIVLHAALSFSDITWVVQDRARAPEFGIVVSAIHGFRMPLFFLLSGFFTAMLWRRRGLKGLLKHRAMRIALPLAISYATIAPTMALIWVWADSVDDPPMVAEPSEDVWAAALRGDVGAINLHLARGAAIDTEDPTYGQSPLAWAVIGDQPEAIDALLAAGADPSHRYRDQNTAMHTAAFFGRAEAAARLLRAGADPNACNSYGETPLDSLRHDQGTTEYIAGLLRLPIDFERVAAGREHIRQLLADRGAISGLANPEASSAAPGSDPGVGPRLLDRVLGALMYRDFWLHLWFLWFLCWLIGGFAIVVSAMDRLPRVRIPSIFIATPLCLLWLVPLTMLPQSFMHGGGAQVGFGPDLSTGILPIPHVLGYHAIFFGFGAILYCTPQATARLARGWWIQLPIALLLFPAGFALAMQTQWGREVAGDEQMRRAMSNIGQVLYVWLMIFGLMGLFQALLSRQRSWVRYVSDSSYWLYIAHLPLVIAGQILLRNVELPAGVKLALLVVTSSAILLVSYQLFVRYTWIGRMLNGPRKRRGTKPREAGQEPVAILQRSEGACG